MFFGSIYSCSITSPVAAREIGGFCRGKKVSLSCPRAVLLNGMPRSLARRPRRARRPGNKILNEAQKSDPVPRSVCPRLERSYARDQYFGWIRGDSPLTQRHAEPGKKPKTCRPTERLPSHGAKDWESKKVCERTSRDVSERPRSLVPSSEGRERKTECPRSLGKLAGLVSSASRPVPHLVCCSADWVRSRPCRLEVLSRRRTGSDR